MGGRSLSLTVEIESISQLGKPLNEYVERFLVDSNSPKNTRYNTKWAGKFLEDWKSCREDKTPWNLVSSSIVFGMSKIQDLCAPFCCMNAATLNMWLSRFNGKGERYPPRTICYNLWSDVLFK